jgi:hypothetical protein
MGYLAYPSFSTATVKIFNEIPKRDDVPDCKILLLFCEVIVVFERIKDP